MKTLIIGGSGFVGPHLITRVLKDFGGEVVATSKSGKNGYKKLNILDRSRIRDILLTVQPDLIFYLAAQSSVRNSWSDPCYTATVNIEGSMILLEELKAIKRKTRLLMIGSSEEYGYIQPDQEERVKETYVTRPCNFYGVTKVCQNLMANFYSASLSSTILSTRTFNHFGPGQSPDFVISSFCKQIAEIELARKDNVIRVGNLDAVRDFTDVRDVVKAYTKLILFGKKGETYNVGSGVSRKISDILSILISFSQVPIEVEVDPLLFRPIDFKSPTADISKLKLATGWSPGISLEESLLDTLNYWRREIGQQG